MGVGQEAASPRLEAAASVAGNSTDTSSGGGGGSSSSALDSAGWRGVLMQRVSEDLVPAAATGLSNEAGEYNCFLNVIIQCLWHCADFRAQVGPQTAGVPAA